MSYDLEVYGKVSLRARELAKVVSSVRGLKATVDRRSQTISSIVHKRGRAVAFELDGPDQLEPEDLPEEWTEVAGATVRYSIHVSYDVQSSVGFSFSVDETNLTAATAFAARLAERVDGTVIDPQTHESPEREPEPAPEPEPPRPRYLHLRWYRLLDDEHDKDLAEIYLRTARELFPPGVPSRFGAYEPFQGRFPRDDDALFDVMYREECVIGDLLLAGKPIEHGSIEGWTNDLRGRIQEIRLTFELDRLVKLKAVDAIEPFVVALAERAGCFFAFAEVSTRRLGTAQVFMDFTLDDPWSGLPTAPQWLTWFGPEYAELVAPHLDPTRMTANALGTLHRWTEHPAAADELRALSGEPWIPADFRGVVDPDPDSDGRCIKAAEIMPTSLRYPAPGSPQALRIEAHFARMREIEADARKRAAEGRRR